MASQEKWSAAASQVVGEPVSEAVPLARQKEGGTVLMVLGFVLFAVVVVVVNLVLPVSRFWGYFVGAALMATCIQLAQEPLFAVRTPGGIRMTGSTRWTPRPIEPPLGPLDPAIVTGPLGLWRNVYVIGGVKHRTSAWQSGRFRKMLGAGPTP